MKDEIKVVEIPHRYLKENTYMYSTNNNTYIVSSKEKKVAIYSSEGKVILSIDEINELYRYIGELETMLEMLAQTETLNYLYPIEENSLEASLEARSITTYHETSDGELR